MAQSSDFAAVLQTGAKAHGIDAEKVLLELVTRANRDHEGIPHQLRLHVLYMMLKHTEHAHLSLTRNIWADLSGKTIYGLIKSTRWDTAEAVRQIVDELREYPPGSAMLLFPGLALAAPKLPAFIIRERVSHCR